LVFYHLMSCVVDIHCTNQRIISFRIEIFYNLFIINSLHQFLSPVNKAVLRSERAVNNRLHVFISLCSTKTYAEPERGRQPFAEGFLPMVTFVRFVIVLYAVGFQFPLF
jgi:hypothetical protein